MGILENFFPFIVIGVILILIGGAVWLSAKMEKKRAEGWRQAASELGVQFLGDHHETLNRFGRMKMFQRGSSRRMFNVIAGDLGPVRVVLGDFRYTTGSGKHKHTHHLTVCIVENDAINIPACFLRPERRFMDALGSLLGGQDIDFVDDPEFSRAFVLQGESEAAVREIFDSEVRAWFCAHQDANLQFEARGNTLALHTGRRRQPEESSQLLQLALEITKVLGRQE